jgi:hypothetical protein
MHFSRTSNIYRKQSGGTRRRHRTVEWRQQWWEGLARQREVRVEQQHQDEVYEWRCLEEMQLRLQRQEVKRRRWREELEQQLRQEAAAADRAAYLTFAAERATGDR